MNRREFLQAIGLTSVAAALPAVLPTAAQASSLVTRQDTDKAIRISVIKNGSVGIHTPTVDIQPVNSSWIESFRHGPSKIEIEGILYDENSLQNLTDAFHSQEASQIVVRCEDGDLQFIGTAIRQRVDFSEYGITGRMTFILEGGPVVWEPV